MRYRVVIEVDTKVDRTAFNKTARDVADIGFAGHNVVYIATEVVNLETLTDKRYVDN